jgi:hypothetical protein
MQLRIKNTKLTLQLIAWIQIVGGIIGLYIMAKLMLQTANVSGGLLLILMIGIMLFMYSIYCGKKLFTNKNKIPALIYSIINYVLQIFQWYLFGYGFTYSSGLEIAAGVQANELKFNFGLSSNFAMSIQTSDANFVKINLLPY